MTHGEAINEQNLTIRYSFIMPPYAILFTPAAVVQFLLGKTDSRWWRGVWLSVVELSLALAPSRSIR